MKVTAHIIIDAQTRYFAPIDLSAAFAMAVLDDNVVDPDAQIQRLKHHNEYIDRTAERIDEFAGVCRNIGVKNIYVQHDNNFAAPNKLEDVSLDANNVAQMNDLYKQNLAAGDEILVKKDKSAFAGTDLLQKLKSEGVERIVISGGMLSDCVAKTALDAAMEGFEVVLARDLIAMADHEFSADVLDAKMGRWERVMGVQNMDNEALADALGFDVQAIAPLSDCDKKALYQPASLGLQGGAPDAADGKPLPRKQNTGKLSK
jgi:nicotinamidase-related amidase